MSLEHHLSLNGCDNNMSIGGKYLEKILVYINYTIHHYHLILTKLLSSHMHTWLTSHCDYLRQSHPKRIRPQFVVEVIKKSRFEQTAPQLLQQMFFCMTAAATDAVLHHSTTTIEIFLRLTPAAASPSQKALLFCWDEMNFILQSIWRILSRPWRRRPTR